MEHLRRHRAVPQTEAGRPTVPIRVHPACRGHKRAERDIALPAVAILRGSVVVRGGLAGLPVLGEEEGGRVPLRLDRRQLTVGRVVDGAVLAEPGQG